MIKILFLLILYYSKPLDALRISNSVLFPDTDINILPCIGYSKFQCDNGVCINSDLICDGKTDCADGSDETRTNCMKPGLICPDTAFRCDYGACIDGDLQCNGKYECADNSDEKSSICFSHSKNTSSISNCKDDEFRCEDGQCIDRSSLCDGSTECNDRSDETKNVCEHTTCESNSFKCNYGACISKNKKCDGARDCADGSDENSVLCRMNTVATRKPSATTTTTTQNPLSVKPPCRAPEQPENGQWKLHRSQCQDNDHCDAKSKVNLEAGTYLVYKCNSGYELNGNGDVFCGPTGKWSNTPNCTEIRCKSLNSESIITDCTYQNEWTSCEPSALPGTIAKIRCRSASFRPDTSVFGLQRDTVTCNKNGKWEPDPIRCVSVCGERTTKLTPLIVNGRQTNIPEFPWHATLYKTDYPSENAEKKFICGATIIQNNLLVTAAHCVFDESVQRIYDSNLYYVATGNIFRDYDNPSHNPQFVHKRKVKKIYAKCDYLGYNGNYASDIALLHVEEPFIFTPSLLPICLDTSSNDQIAIDVGKNGSVAGFGRTETSDSSVILQAITVPVVSLTECRSVSTSVDARKFITDDKFCAGYKNGSSVCDGDSGGGLVFDDKSLWYLRGIVSVGIGAQTSGGIRTCNSHLYSLYTKVSRHITWIQDIILKLETNKTIRDCHPSSTPTRHHQNY